jgi:OOP family OmpA-OmpF porin
VLAGKAAQPTLERADATKPFPDLGTALSEDARAQLDELLKAPIVEAGGPIVLRGHTDSQGYDGDNLVVSRRRAEAVARYLEQGGVAPERISIIALGEARPVAPNAMPDGSDDPDGRARNRHVEVEILPPAERRLGRRRPPILNRFSRVIDTPRRSVIFLLN